MVGWNQFVSYLSICKTLIGIVPINLLRTNSVLVNELVGFSNYMRIALGMMRG